MTERDAERLAAYDRMYRDLLAERDRIAGEMDRLRTAGKTKTVTYRQWMADKLLTQNLIGRFEIYGIK